MRIFRGGRLSGKSTRLLILAIEKSKSREIVIFCGTREMARHLWESTQNFLLKEEVRFVIDSYLKEIIVDGRRPIIFTTMEGYLRERKSVLYQPLIFIDELDKVLENTLNTKVELATTSMPIEGGNKQ